MNIKLSIYERLTTKQRILAAVEAQKRGDQYEIAKLIGTIPVNKEGKSFDDLLLELSTKRAERKTLISDKPMTEREWQKRYCGTEAR